MDGEWSRTVGCEDRAGREKSLLVYLSEKSGRIVIQAPPGEVAVITLTGGTALKQAITDAQLEASHRGLSQP